MPCPRRLVPALLACVAALPAVEADQPTIIVTAERLPSDAERSTTTLSVITSDDITRAGQPVQVMDHLVTVPGVELTQTGGGPGGPISIIMRGTRPHDTQVLLDGVPLSDPAAPQSNPDLAYLLPAGLQRIEVLKGAQSGLYGSRAIGGVVNLIGPRPTAGHDGSLLVEAGSFRTVRSEAVATGPLGGGIGYAATLSGMGTHGFSSQATPADAGDPSGYEADGFQRYGGTLRLEVPLTSDLAAYVSGALARGKDEYDDFASPDDADSLKRLRAARLGAGLGGRIGMTDVAVDAAGTAYTREYPGNTVERYDADELYLSARARRQVHDQVSLLVGADGKRSAIDIPDSFDAHDRNLGVYTTIGYDNGRDVVDATARLDVHDREGDATTFRIGVARFAWDDRLKLHGSVATGFRAPSLYELYAPDDYGSGPIGNPELKPQRNTTYDLGQQLRPLPSITIATVYFRTEYEEAIIFNGFTGPYVNTGSGVVVEGVEASLDYAEPGDPMSAQLFATWQHSDDGDGDALTYVPQQSGGVRLGYDLPVGWASFTVKRTGYQYAGSDESERLDGRTLVDVVIGWRATAWLTVQARAENLTDVAYETYRGFGASYTGAPRQFLLGAQASW